jgi:hypothetical protein
MDYKLKSGITVRAEHLTPIAPEIKPEPGDIVAVKLGSDNHEHIRIFMRMEKRGYVCNRLLDLDESFAAEWPVCRVIARKPKRWEEISEDKQNIIRRSMFIFGHEHIGMPREEAYDKILSIILDGVPYARIAE